MTTDMRGGAWLLACGLLAAACTASGPSPATGLTGTVVRGPITPVCRIDVRCDAPFSAGFTVERGGRAVSRFRSDAAGQFTVLLDPGAYNVVPDGDAPVILPGRQSKPVTIGDAGLTTVQLTFDTGIR